MSTEPAGASPGPTPPEGMAPSAVGCAPAAKALVSRIALTLSPDWRHVRPLRDYVSGVALAFSRPRDFADRCAMCASELLENAVKYSLDGTEIQVVVEMDLRNELMQVCVENQAPSERIEDLQKVLTTVNSGGPFDSYILLLSQAAAKEGATSKVGLGRVRAEGSAWIRFDCPTESTVRITVSIPERRNQSTTDGQRELEGQE
jgi:hypothetical protein